MNERRKGKKSKPVAFATIGCFDVMVSS